MITRDDREFYKCQQSFVFISPDADTDYLTPDDVIITDAEELATVGCPMRDDEEFEFYAVLQPGETMVFPEDEGEMLYQAMKTVNTQAELP